MCVLSSIEMKTAHSKSIANEETQKQKMMGSRASMAIAVVVFIIFALWVWGSWTTESVYASAMKTYRTIMPVADKCAHITDPAIQERCKTCATTYSAWDHEKGVCISCDDAAAGGGKYSTIDPKTLICAAPARCKDMTEVLARAACANCEESRWNPIMSMCCPETEKYDATKKECAVMTESSRGRRR